METNFERWEKDPFFAAAEEVQDSVDRMESTCRQWIQLRKGVKKPAAVEEEFIQGEVLRELHTALGTAKWQLEELDRAIRLNDDFCYAGEDTRFRHSQFIEAIGNRISGAESSLREWSLETRRTALTWVRLDEGERDELAQFLSCNASEKERPFISSAVDVKLSDNLIDINHVASAGYSDHSSHSDELNLVESKEGRVNRVRRTASAAGDIGAWTVMIPSDGEDTSERSSEDRPNLPLSRVLSFSALSSALESTSRMRWYRKGFRKGKTPHQHDPVKSIPLNDLEVNRGADVCYGRSKSCLTDCRDDTYHKQIYGWFVGAFWRQLQRSLYQIRYRRPTQMIVWAILSFLLIVVIVLHMMK